MRRSSRPGTRSVSCGVVFLVTALLASSACSTSGRRGGVASGSTAKEGTTTSSLVTGGPAQNDSSSGPSPAGPSSAGNGIDQGQRASQQGGHASPNSNRGTSTTASPRRAGSHVGITANSIAVSVIQGFSGPSGAIVDRLYEEGFGTWVKDVNARGGIHGRKVILKKVDHKETADGGVGACKEVLSNGSFMAFIASGQGDGNVAAAGCLDKAGFLNLAFLGDRPSAWRHTYSFLASAKDQGLALATFVRNAMGDGHRKLGVIYLTLPVYASAKNAYVSKAKSLGSTIVGVEAVEPNQASFTAQLLRLQQAGAANVAIIAGLEAVGILRDSAALDYHPHFTGLYWIFDTMTQIARDTAKGARGLRVSATVETPANAEFRRKAAQYGSNSTTNESLVFYGMALLLGRVLEGAGGTPTQETLRAGLESITNYNNQILPPITYGPGDFVGTSATFPAVCCLSDYAWGSSGAARDQY